MISLRDKDTGADLGTISEEQLRFLVDQLEEEYDEDRDYYINSTMLDVLEQNGADIQLLEILRNATGDREGVEIQWSIV